MGKKLTLSCGADLNRQLAEAQNAPPEVYLRNLLRTPPLAGASRVDIIHEPEDLAVTLKFDGDGIENFHTFGKVRYNEVKDGRPFGRHFILGLFAAQCVKVRSNGTQIHAVTNLMIQRPVKLTECEDTGYTEVRLEGVNDDCLKKVVADLVKGYPIPVTLNGEDLPRPHAMDSGLQFIDTAAGKMHLPGIDVVPVFDPDNQSEEILGDSQGFAIYLGGLPVGFLREDAKDPTVLHLDPERFKDDITTPFLAAAHWGDINRAVSLSVRDAWQARCRELKGIMEPKMFAESMYWTLYLWGCLDLLNDVPYLPPQAVHHVKEMPRLNTTNESESIVANATEAIPKEHFDTRQAIAVRASLEPEQGMSFHPLHYLYELALQNEGHDYYVLLNDLPKGHWLAQHRLPDINGETVKVVLPEEGVSEYQSLHIMKKFDGTGEKIKVSFGGHVVLSGPLGMVEATRPFYLADEHCMVGKGRIVVPNARDFDPMVIRQVYCFKNDDEEFEERWVREEMNRFSIFISSLSGNAEIVLKQLLDTMSIDDLCVLANREFSVVVYEDKATGKLHFGVREVTS